MKARARLEMPFDSEEEARRMMEALKADDDGYLTQTVEGSTLVVEAEADGPGSLRQTLEDYMACLAGALSASKAAKPDVEPEDD